MEKITTRPRTGQGAYSEFIDSLLKEYKSGFGVFKETGIILPVMGGAKGYNETNQIPFHTVDGYDLNELWAEFNEAIRLMNENRGKLVEWLTVPVSKPIERIPQVFVEDFEEADEYARPKGIRPAGYWDLGFDMTYHDLATRFTWRYLGESDARQVRQVFNAGLEASRRLVYRRVLTRLFDNTTWNATLRGGTAVNVYPIYNGDNPVAPPSWESYTFDADHDHFLVSGGAAVVSGDLYDMYKHIYHHGYTQGGAKIVLLVNEQEADVIRTFRVADGDRWDFIPANDGIAFYLNGQIVGGQPTNDTGLNVFPGFIGNYGPIRVVQLDLLPAGYMTMFGTGGNRADRNIIGVREHDNAALRGLKLFPGGTHTHYPLIESYMHQTMGVGVRHRGAGVVMQVKATGDYEIPSLTYGGPGGR